MNINKKVVLSNETLEMKASEKISTYVKENVLEMGEDVSSLKVVNRVVKNGQISDSHLEFIMRILGQLRSDSNGSFSISFPHEQSEEMTEKLALAAKNIHGEIEYILDTVYAMLPDDQKEQGKQIQKQNVLRQKMLGKLQNVSDARERVENFLQAKKLIVIPEGAYMELKIVGGALVFGEKPGEFWKTGKPVVVNKVSRSTWRANWDLYGRTRLPLSTEEISEFALKSVFGLAKSFEEFWAGRQITSSTQIIEDFLAWSETLAHKDTKVTVHKLSDVEMDEIEKQATELFNEMMKWD